MTILQGEGMCDKVLAEYIINIYKLSDACFNSFKTLLKESGAELNDSAISDIFTLIGG